MRERIASSLQHLLVLSFSIVLCLLPFKFGIPLLEKEAFEFPVSFWDWILVPYWPVEFFVFIGLALFFIWIIKNIFSTQFVFRWNLGLTLFTLFFVLLIFLSPLSVYPYASKIMQQQLGGYLLFFFLAVQIFSKEDSSLLRAVTWFVAGASLIALWGLYQHFIGFGETLEWLQNEKETVHHNVLSRLKGKRAFGTFIYPNSLAGYLLLTIPISFALFWVFWKKARAKALLFFILVGLVAFLFLGFLPSTPLLSWVGAAVGVLVFPVTQLICLGLTFSKGGIAALSLAAFFFLLWSYFWKEKRISFAALKKVSVKKWLLVACGLILILTFFWHYREFWSHRIKMPTLQNRGDYWQAGAQMWRERPLLGWGPGTFGVLYPTHKSLLAEKAQHAHNDYLQIAVESGLVGLLLFLAFLLLIYFKGLKGSAKPGASSPLLPAILWGVLALSIHHGADFDFYIPGLGGCEWIFLGILSAHYLKNWEISIPLKSFLVRSLAFCFILLTGLLIVKPLGNQLSAKMAYDLARRHLQIKDIDSALKWADQAIQKEGKNARFYLLRGNILSKSGQPKEALGAYQDAASKNPLWALPYTYQANLYLKKWKQDKSKENSRQLIEAWRGSLDRRPTEIESRLKFAAFLEKNGFLEDALIEYRAVLAWDPAHSKAQTKAREISQKLLRFFKDQALKRRDENFSDSRT